MESFVLVRILFERLLFEVGKVGFQIFEGVLSVGLNLGPSRLVDIDLLMHGLMVVLESMFWEIDISLRDHKSLFRWQIVESIEINEGWRHGFGEVTVEGDKDAEVRMRPLSRSAPIRKAR